MRFGRKRDAEQTDESAPDGVSAAPAGPVDVTELGEPGEEYVDLGSLLLRPQEGTELRLQIDEDSGEVLAVLLVSEEGMLEVRAFAAARGGDLWSEVRREIAADTARRGGTADERQGPFGPELVCQVPVELEDGTSGLQPSRVIGCNGPRWFLRVALMGRPAIEPETAGPWEETIRGVVVRRGNDAMPPGEALSLRLPPDARRID